jgi:hypothetical protein
MRYETSRLETLMHPLRSVDHAASTNSFSDKPTNDGHMTLIGGMLAMILQHNMRTPGLTTLSPVCWWYTG